MFLLLDNYDSFTYNLVQYMGELGASCDVVRNDEFRVEEVVARGYAGVVISPGPGTPEQTGAVLPLIQSLPARVPLLGVCLGHQCLARSLGGEVIRTTPFHGKISVISHSGNKLFSGLPTQFAVTRYHSLTVNPRNLPAELEVIATCGEIIMGIAQRDRPRFGVQFHPESIGTAHGRDIIRNFLRISEEV